MPTSYLLIEKQTINILPSNPLFFVNAFFTFNALKPNKTKSNNSLYQKHGIVLITRFLINPLPFQSDHEVLSIYSKPSKPKQQKKKLQDL